MNTSVLCSFSVEERSILEKMQSAFLIAQVYQGEIKTVLASDGVCELFGLKREQAIKYFDTGEYTNVHPDDRVWVKQKITSFYQRRMQNSNFIYRSNLHGSDHYSLINIDVKQQKIHNADVVSLNFANLGLSSSSQNDFTNLLKEQQYQLIDTSLSGALVISVKNHNLLFNNHRLVEILNLELASHKGIECHNFFKEYFYPEDDNSTEHINILATNKLDKTQEIFKNNRIFAIKAHKIVWDNQSAILLLINDVSTNFRKSDNELLRYERTHNTSMLGTWDWNVITNKIKINDAWSLMLGLEPVDEITYAKFASLIKNHQIVSRFRSSHYSNGIEYFDDEFQMRHANGHLVWIYTQGQVVERDSDGNKLRVCGTHQDITKIKKRNQQLKYATEHDLLTKTANRLAIKNLLEEKISYSQPLTLVFIDIFNMREINDSFSYEVGDLLLIEMAKKLESLQTQHLILGRLTDNGFALVYPTADKSLIQKYADAITNTFATSIHINENIATRINIGVGISSFPNNAQTPEDLIRKANTAANYVRRHKINCAVFYDDSFTKESAQNMQIKNLIVDALHNDYFYLMYQPQIQISTQKIFGVEALIRCKHPQAGDIYPNEFIPIAEKSGLIYKVDMWVFKTACLQGRKWLDEGRDFGVLSINTTTDELQDPRYISDVKKILAETKFPAQKLYIEVTERIVIDTPDYINDIFKQLHDLGIKVAIDDFGTGYSSLSYLKKLNVQKLKIDRSFVTHIDRDITQQQLVTTIISMAKSLNLSIIAEGVETKEEVNILSDLGCDFIQGYFYSKPQLSDKLTNWF